MESKINVTLNSIKIDQKIQYENFQVLSFVQASLGLITRKINTITIECIDEKVILYFYLQENYDKFDDDAIDEIVSEMLALQVTGIPIIAIKIVDSKYDFNSKKRVLYYQSENRLTTAST